MKVCIDDYLTVECSHLLNGGATWNGFVVPVFTDAEKVEAVKACESAGFIVRGADGVPVDSEYGEPCVFDLGHDAWLIGEGWVWQRVQECTECGALIEDEESECGDSVGFTAE